MRELHKLLNDFGDGTTVGVDVGSKTRQRPAHSGASSAADHTERRNGGSNSSSEATGTSAQPPLKKRTIR